MNIRHLSTTLLQAWPVCPARAWHDHSRRVATAEGTLEGTEATKFGSVVHTVCEQFHVAAMNGTKLKSPVDLFDAAWRASGGSDTEYFLFGRSRIEEFLDRTLYEREGDTVGVEVPFLLDVDAGQVWLWDEVTPKRVLSVLAKEHVPVVSKIDRIDRVDDGYYQVFDYKTNVMPFSRWEVENSIQLGTYALATRAMYPEAERVLCVYDMLRHGRQPVEFTGEQLEAFRAYLRATWHQIHETEAPEPRLNQFCRWCALRGRCPEYHVALQSQVQPVLTEDADGFLDRLYGQLEGLKLRKKVIDARIEEIEEQFAAFFTESLGQPIRLGDGSEAYLSPNPRYEFPTRDVYELMKRRDAVGLFVEAATLGKTKLEKLLKGRGPMRDEVLALLERRYVKPTLRRRSVGSTEDVPPVMGDEHG